MQLFYSPDIERDETSTLNKDESRHAIRVLRLKEEDSLYITDGRGHLFRAKILDSNPNRTKIRVVETHKEYNKPSPRIHYGFALTKNISRIEWFLEKATELGIEELSPMITEHSERDKLNYERMDNVLIAAMKQSLKAYKPKLNPLRTFDEIINESNEERKLIGYCDTNQERYKIKDIYNKGESVLVMIGPEGDFTAKEVEQAQDRGFEIINLGESRLRTETAALYSLSTIHSINL